MQIPIGKAWEEGRGQGSAQARWFWLVAIVCAGVAGVIAFAAMPAQRHGRQVLLEEEQAADK